MSAVTSATHDRSRPCCCIRGSAVRGPCSSTVTAQACMWEMSAPNLYKWSRISFNNNDGKITRRHDEICWMKGHFNRIIAVFNRVPISKHDLCSSVFFVSGFHRGLPVDCATKSGPFTKSRGFEKLLQNLFLHKFHVISLNRRKMTQTSVVDSISPARCRVLPWRRLAEKRSSHSRKIFPKCIENTQYNLFPRLVGI